MANFFYDAIMNKAGTAGFDWTGWNIKVMLVDAADYTPAPTTHDFLDDVPAIARVAISGNLASKTCTGGGILDAADVTINNVTGDVAELLIGFHDTGTESTSDLIFCFDTATGLPFTPNTSNATITWDATGIARL